MTMTGTLPRLCPSCGVELGATALFCVECGTAAPRERRPGSAGKAWYEQGSPFADDDEDDLLGALARGEAVPSRYASSAQPPVPTEEAPTRGSGAFVPREVAPGKVAPVVAAAGRGNSAVVQRASVEAEPEKAESTQVEPPEVEPLEAEPDADDPGLAADADRPHPGTFPDDSLRPLPAPRSADLSSPASGGTDFAESSGGASARGDLLTREPESAQMASSAAAPSGLKRASGGGKVTAPPKARQEVANRDSVVSDLPGQADTSWRSAPATREQSRGTDEDERLVRTIEPDRAVAPRRGRRRLLLGVAAVVAVFAAAGTWFAVARPSADVRVAAVQAWTDGNKAWFEGNIDSVCERYDQIGVGGMWRDRATCLTAEQRGFDQATGEEKAAVGALVVDPARAELVEPDVVLIWFRDATISGAPQTFFGRDDVAVMRLSDGLWRQAGARYSGRVIGYLPRGVPASSGSTDSGEAPALSSAPRLGSSPTASATASKAAGPSGAVAVP